ncbi:MAG TPA: limonene-1,2-epoxide hydrolase family protein [Myxococcota bacterium]|jgi:limonene-1,2-epoxide hydrolase|nr:limonene-1,2-epoxide hydrolase family protein [Myxococcota bacterium]
MDPEKTVRAFCDAFARRDAKELLGFLAPDCVYHNIPLAPLTGHAAIEPMLAQFLAPCTRVEFEMKALAVDGRVVLTERVDRFWLANGKTIELPVMGTFEVGRDGKITAWRDYFDLAQWTKQMA